MNCRKQIDAIKNICVIIFTKLILCNINDQTVLKITFMKKHTSCAKPVRTTAEGANADGPFRCAAYQCVPYHAVTIRFVRKPWDIHAASMTPMCSGFLPDI